MDTFFEQIVRVKKTGKDYGIIIGIWIAACLVSYFAMLFLARLLPLALAAIFLVFYGAFKLSKMRFIEYEYIVTNDCLDIDKIVAKSSRKRVMSIDVKNVSSIEKFSLGAKLPEGAEKTLVACDADSNEAYILTASAEGKGRSVLVFTPNDRVKEGIVKFLPKYIANSAFKQ